MPLDERSLKRSRLIEPISQRLLKSGLDAKPHPLFVVKRHGPQWLEYTVTIDCVNLAHTSSVAHRTRKVSES